MKIDFHPEAAAELEVSADWYAARSPEAARGFAIQIDASLSAIANKPQRYPFVDKQHQACSVSRFPFQIVFRKDDQRILVVAIAHAKRRPGYWKRRG